MCNNKETYTEVLFVHGVPLGACHLEVGISNWRLVVDAAFQALKMKQREQGSIFSDQKFKGLNYRWFGGSKGRGVNTNCGELASTSNVINRGTVIVIKMHPTKRLLVHFSKHYHPFRLSRHGLEWVWIGLF
jgi:hypothetical protein